MHAEKKVPKWNNGSNRYACCLLICCGPSLPNRKWLPDPNATGSFGGGMSETRKKRGNLLA